MCIIYIELFGQGFVSRSEGVKIHDESEDSHHEINNGGNSPVPCSRMPLFRTFSLPLALVFLEHCVLDPSTNGHDPVVEDAQGTPHPIKVRPRKGLAAMEYLSDTPLIKESSRLLVGLTSAMRVQGYVEWDGVRGNLLGAPYDWRLMFGSYG